MTDTDRPTYRTTPLRRMLALARNTWRGLTSMRTALVLLFLLAVAAMPGAMLPQRSLNAERVDEYIADHGWWGRLLNTLGFFEVYSSVWFSAIYLLLMVSLVGCLVPRSREYVTALRAKPVRTPRNLARLPHYTEFRTADDPDTVLQSVRGRLKGWRVAENHDDGGRSLSAEKGFLHETGNLVFHFAMLGLIIAFALGKMFSYEGQVIVHADGSQFCNSGVYAYDSFNPGLQVDGSELTPFCFTVEEFTPTFLPNGQPEQYAADLEYATEDDLASGTSHPYDLRVNEPLRVEGDRVYLLDHGFAPVFTVTFPDGQERTLNTQWRPTDQTTYLSEGATKFDRPGLTDEAERRDNQLAVTGLFAPTAQMDGQVLTSAGPELDDPAVAVDIMRGDLGLDSGRGQSIFNIDQSQVDKGALERVARENMSVGDEITLDDGTQVSFDGVERWVGLQVSRDSTQVWVLGFAVAMLVGLAGSLLVKRRRIWVRVTPEKDVDGTSRTVVAVGGLARTDQAGYGEEFAAIADDMARRSS